MNNTKSKNIPAFLQKTYNMLEVPIKLIKGFKERLRHHMVPKWSRIHHFELGTAHKTCPTNLFQAFQLLIFYQTGTNLKFIEVKHVRFPQDKKRKYGKLLSSR